MPVIFISYRRSDSQDVTGRIYDRLVAKFTQKQVFKDVDNIPLGVSFPMHIKQMLTKANVALVIIGPNWVNATDENGKRRLDDPNDTVRLEVELALRANMPVIPVLVSNAKMPQANELPTSMRKLVDRNGMAVRSDPDFNNDMGRLFSGIDHLERILTANASKPRKGKNASTFPRPQYSRLFRPRIVLGLGFILLVAGVSLGWSWRAELLSFFKGTEPPGNKDFVKDEGKIARPNPPEEMKSPAMLKLVPPEQKEPLVTNKSKPQEEKNLPAKIYSDSPKEKKSPNKVASPPILECTGPDGANPKRVKMAQKEWAEYLQSPIEESIDLGNGVDLELVLVPPGKFMMGSPIDQKGRGSDEVLHEVELTRPFYVGKYAVTQQQYSQVMQVANPSYFSASGDDKDSVKGLDTKRFPVEGVSHDKAKDFCQQIQQIAKHGRGKFATWRLPTEAEWEYAGRAGTRTPFHFGAILNGSQANCNGQFPYGTQIAGKNLRRPCSVGQYPSNALGLYDMHGNVWHWCNDRYGEYGAGTQVDPTGAEEGSAWILRGGAWNCRAEQCTSSFRYSHKPNFRISNAGFRVLAIPMVRE